MISKSCGVLPHTLRAWESRYSVFNPERDEKGKRIYSESDLHKANLLASLVGAGHTISSLATYTIKELKSLSSDIQKFSTNSHEQNDHQISSKLLKHLELYEIEKVTNELQYLRQSSSTKNFILRTILPIMREVGIMVSNGKYSVTQEHIMSTIVRDQLSQITLQNIDGKLNHVAIATPDGNLHELSIIIANILCRSYKVTTRYLGASHPATCLAEAINILKTPIIILGSVTSDSWDYKKSIVPYLDEMDRSLALKVTVILGGGFDMNFPAFKKIEKVIVMPTFEEFDKYLENLL